MCKRNKEKKSAKPEFIPSCTIICVKPEETFVEKLMLYVIQHFQIRGISFKPMLREIGYVSCIYLK